MRSATSSPQNLLRLRWLFTALGLLCVYTTARALQIHHHDFEPCSDLLYTLVVSLFTWGACALAWSKRWQKFVSLAIVGRVISAQGALLYLARILLAESYHPAKHLDVLGWNLGSAGLSIFLVAYLVRQFPPNVNERPDTLSASRELRVLRWVFLVASAMGAFAVAPEVWRHLTEEGMHMHSCAWTVCDALVVALTSWACVCAWRKQWQRFASLGFISQTLTAFGSFCTLSVYFFPETSAWYEPASHRAFMFRHLPQFAFSVFMAVYLGRRFPPSLAAGKVDG